MNIIYIDDEKPAIDNFRLTLEKIQENHVLHTFQDGNAALAFIKDNIVDAVFMDIEMPGIHGIELAKKIKEHDAQIRIIFVTAYSEYALEAWGVDATGYVVKPYSIDEIRKELAKCTYKVLPSCRVVIETIPTLSLMVDGKPFRISGAKPREMFALLVDRGKQGFSVGEGIACLWPERSSDSGTQSLCRMTWKRLNEALETVGVGDILMTSDNRRYLRTELVDCDLYRILDGDIQARRKYSGEYLREYEWADERNAQLHWMILDKEPDYN